MIFFLELELHGLKDYRIAYKYITLKKIVGFFIIDLVSSFVILQSV